MATRTNWKTIYSELPDHVAEALRTARVKPEQLTEKTDGEILSIEGINDTALEAIRAQYPAKIVEDKKETPTETKEEIAETKKPKKEKIAPKKIRTRSKRYQALNKKIDKTKTYDLKTAVDLLKKLSASRKQNTLELNLNLTDSGIRGEAKLPHSTGKQIKIEIFSDSTIAKLNANETDFDLLLARPADMAKLARYARLLGPKGLMPNPKNGSISDNPEKRAEDLAKGATMSYKSEAKFPIMHLSFGKITQDENHLAENIKSLINTLGPKKVKSAFLKTTQSPSLKLDIINTIY
jgi:large subunit ribosomal protein L1